jgi:hypothetical protein
VGPKEAAQLGVAQWHTCYLQGMLGHLVILYLFQSRLEESNLHRKKSFSIFSSPAGMSLTELSLGGNYDVIYRLFLPRESLVSDILSGDGNIEKLFSRCKVFNIIKRSTNFVPVEKIAMHVGKSLAMTLRRLELWLNVVEKLLKKCKRFFLFSPLSGWPRMERALLLNTNINVS